MPQPSTEPLTANEKANVLARIASHGKNGQPKTVSDNALHFMRGYIESDSDISRQHQAAKISANFDGLNPSQTRWLSYDELARYCTAMGILQTHTHQKNPHNQNRGASPQR